MASSILQRIPIVAGVAFIERVRRLPPTFTATLVAEPDHRYFRQAIAVIVNAGKVGYVAPEISRLYFDALKESGEAGCPGRLAARSDHETSGVEILLDFSALSIAAAP